MILSRNRLFTSQEPDRDAKKIYIFCDGVKREKQYFNYFKKIDSRINIEVYALQHDEDNSPLGLYNIAMSCIQTETNPNGKYDFNEGQDEVWLVMDIDPDKFDSRKRQIEAVKANCAVKKWHVTLSNPCFEVWLYFHFNSQKPDFQNVETCNQWKQFLQKEIGGFDSKKHPLFIQTAINNAQAHIQQNDNQFPIVATTEVHKLAKSILSIGKIQHKIDSELINIR